MDEQTQQDAKRYKFMRTLLPWRYERIWKYARKHGAWFDALIDQAMHEAEHGRMDAFMRRMEE